MSPETFAQAIASIEHNYGLRLDATQCGRGWAGTKPGCERAGKATSGQPAKAPEAKPNESEVLKSTLQRLKEKLQASIAKDKELTPPVKAKGNDIPPYTVKKTLGEGAFGKAELTTRGTVVKVSTGFDVSEDDVKREFDGVKHFHKLGIGPEAIGIKGKDIEIGLVEGTPLVDIKNEKAQMSAQMEAAKALLKLHKSGWSHNDAHDENLILQKDGSVKLIDAGQAMSVGGKVAELSNGAAIVSRSGLNDIERIAPNHPVLGKLKKALKKDLAEHLKAVSQASDRSMDKYKSTEMKQSAELKLHKAYLAIADQYIK